MTDIERQLPAGHEIFLDHVGHFVREPDAASAALTRAGFAPTAVSVQVAPDPSDGKPRPTGTGNVTAMFRRGYMEVLFKTADTPLGLEFEASLKQFSGLHLAAFSVADAEAAHRRLAAAGFAMRPLVYFERPVSTATGPGTAAFTVTRVERGAMAEGRIQILAHRTEDMVWQPRWLDHPNGAEALLDLVIAVDDVDEAAARFARFTGRTPTAVGERRSIRLDRGRVELITRSALATLLPEVAIPHLPFMAGYAVRVWSLDDTETVLRLGGIAARRDGGVLVAAFPAEIGVGAWLFVERAADLPWRR
jgi:hypothetical protein